MGERLLCKQEVIGSIPFTSTTAQCAWRIVASRGSGCLCNRESGLVQERAPSSARKRSGEDTVFASSFRLAARFLIFDRVKREYLGERLGRR